MTRLLPLILLFCTGCVTLTERLSIAEKSFAQTERDADAYHKAGFVNLADDRAIITGARAGHQALNAAYSDRDSSSFGAAVRAAEDQVQAFKATVAHAKARAATVPTTQAGK